LIWPNEIFFDPKEKIEQFGILGEIFQIQTQTKDADLTQPGSKTSWMTYKL